MTLPDLRALLRRFADGNVSYVVIGGIALVLHGGIRTTEDLDIVPDPDQANLDRLWTSCARSRAYPTTPASRRIPSATRSMG